MPKPRRSHAGYTLIELLVVLTIVGIISVVGVMMLTGNRGSGSVRLVLDELEGTILNAQKMASASGQDVTVVSQGDWSATTGKPLILAISSSPAQTPSQIIAAGLKDPASFKVGLIYNGSTPVALMPEHSYAGVVTEANRAWWTAALNATSTGAQNQNPTTVEPFLDQSSFQNSAGQSILNDSTFNLFTGNGAADAVANGGTISPGILSISGLSKRFLNTQVVLVVGLRGGQPYAGAPMGILVVLANGATVYKFYNPGVVNGDGLWRKI